MPSLFDLPKELPTSFDAYHGWTLSWLLPLLCCLIVGGYAWIARAQSSPAVRARLKKALLSALALCAALSVLVYVDFGVFRYGTYLNEWDVYHYYLGSKYAPELGYENLYGATLVADAETGLKYTNPEGKLRDLRGVTYISTSSILQSPEKFTQSFSPARWAEFVADVQFFKQGLSKAKWSTLLLDHGYNGTPAWSAVVGAVFTGNLPITEAWSRFILLGLDPLLLLAGLWLVRRAFGIRSALLLTVFIGTHYLFSWGHLKGALLRTDFAVFALMSICCVKLNRFRSAGILIGLATLSRAFPALLLVGPCVLGLDALIRQRQLDRDLLSLATAFLATIVTGVGLGALYGGESQLWSEWVRKIITHMGDLVHWRMGYSAMVGSDWESGVPVLVDWSKKLADEPALLLAHKLTANAIRMAIVIPALYFARGLRRWESMAYSFVFFFFLLQATYYYYLFLIIPMLFFVGDMDKTEPMSRSMGAAFMFLTGAAGYVLFAGWDPFRDTVLFRGWGQYYPTYYFETWLVCLTCVYLIALAAIRTHRYDALPYAPLPPPPNPAHSRE